MISQDQVLSKEHTEIVAVGASVGAGCRPCLRHHLKVGEQAGLAHEQLLAAVAGAERVRAEAATAVGDQARSALGADLDERALSRLGQALASLGAAIGANDAVNIERQLRAAAELGATGAQLKQAIKTANGVQESAARIHLREAHRLLDAVAQGSVSAETDVDSDGGCGCSDNAEAREGPVTANQSVADTDTVGCGCSDDAVTSDAPITAEEAAAPVAACGAMFDRFLSGVVGGTGKARRAAAATSGCREAA